MDVETEVADVMEEVKKNGLIVPVALGLLVLGAGLGVGWVVMQRRKKYEVITLKDRLETRPPKVIVNAEDLEERGKTVDLEILDDEEEVPPVTINETVIENVNIFAHGVEDDWDYEEEISKRNPLAPYVIHKDEFFAEEMENEGYLQESWVYYVGDEVLVDENQKPVYNHEMVVGPLKFGKGSGDPNVVYVRNMTRNMEYEILRDPGHYRVDVLGLELEEATDDKEAKKQARQRRFPKQE